MNGHSTDGYVVGPKMVGWVVARRTPARIPSIQPYAVYIVYRNKPTYMRVQNENYTIGFKGTVLGDWGRLKSGMELCVILQLLI